MYRTCYRQIRSAAPGWRQRARGGERCAAALAALDRAFNDRAEKVFGDLADAVRCLVRLREELTENQRRGDLGDRLDRCNAVLSWVNRERVPRWRGFAVIAFVKPGEKLASLLAERP